MTIRRPGVDWRKAARQLDAEVHRVAGLLRSVRQPSAPALGQWTVADVAVHLSQAWMVVPGLARQDLGEVEELLPRFRHARSVLGDIWELEAVTAEGVVAEPERDPAVLASRIEDRARRYLGALEGTATDRRPWLVEGTEVALVTLTCHLLNETIVHGWDIARGDGRSWDIRAAPAATVLDSFLVPVFQALGPRDMVDQVVAAGLQATFEIRVRGGGRHLFVFDDGALTVEAPSGRPVDCVIDADPAALLLVAWNRIDQAQAIVDRKLVPSGPKAWLAPRLRSLMRNP
ncbi:MAG: maleylpyruvate isomerase N-terminal domain-containing protein [Acidimicrobiales bacterium]